MTNVTEDTGYARQSSVPGRTALTGRAAALAARWTRARPSAAVAAAGERANG